MRPSLFKKIRPSRGSNARRGVAAVEFAVVAPFLFIILFSMVETSRYLTSLHATTGAAREAVRLVSVGGADGPAATALAKEFMEGSNFNPATVVANVVATESDVPGMQVFTAEVTIDYVDVSIIGDPFNFGINKVRGYATMLAPVE